jgi:hypothetical protein
MSVLGGVVAMQLGLHHGGKALMRMQMLRGSVAWIHCSGATDRWGRGGASKWSERDVSESGVEKSGLQLIRYEAVRLGWAGCLLVAWTTRPCHEYQRY